MNAHSICKNVFIVRHGHAATDARIDFERPLDNKGLKQVAKTAKFIKDKCLELDVNHLACICSAAFRTKQTAEIINDVFAFNKIEFQQQLYTSSVSQWLDQIIESKEGNIVVVGHNPTFSQMLNNFCGYQIYMKPANCALIDLEIKADGIIYPARLIEYHSND